MTKGRELAPLLPLEYCRIDRAARMLGCEVEDIIHWHKISAIQLAVQMDRFVGELDFRPSEVGLSDCKDAQSLLEGVERLWLSGAPGGYSSFVCPPREDLEASVEKCIDELSRVNPIELAEDKYAEPLLRIPTSVVGMWTVGNFKDFEVDEQLNLEPLDFGGFFMYHYFEPAYGFGNGGCRTFRFHTKEVITFTKRDLWVLRPDLEGLWHSITTGEPLPNIYNDAELARQAREREAAEQSTREPKVTAKQSDLIVALIDLHFTQEGKRLGDMKHKTFFDEVLSKALAAKGIACPMTYKSFIDWMERSRKFSN
ncbi:hypothetical protein [Zobellella denitrificans]|nr:hypothetical protein [Zobellella denitrificans]